MTISKGKDLFILSSQELQIHPGIFTLPGIGLGTDCGDYLCDVTGI